MTPDHISMARSLLYSLLADVRREAVPLVDAFDVPDEILNSALGRYDGDVYTHLYEWAQRAPRNKKKVSKVLNLLYPSCACAVLGTRVPSVLQMPAVTGVPQVCKMPAVL